MGREAPSSGLWHHFAGIRGSRRESPGEFQIVQIHSAFTAKVTRVTLRCNVFFLICSYPSHLKHLVLRAFWEDCLPEMLSKLGVWAERSMKKSTNTLHWSVTWVTKYCKKQWICMIWNSSADPADPPDPPDLAAGAAARNHPSTRAGGQDDVSSKQTPSNYSCLGKTTKQLYTPYTQEHIWQTTLFHKKT